MAKFPDVKVKLIGEDGNVFSIIGAVTRALKKAGHVEAAQEFSRAAMNSESYDEVLRLTLSTVEIE